MSEQTTATPIGQRLVAILARDRKMRQRLGGQFDVKASVVEKDRAVLLDEVIRLERENTRLRSEIERITASGGGERR